MLHDNKKFVWAMISEWKAVGWIIPSPSFHICSICGSQNHHAGSQNVPEMDRIVTPYRPDAFEWFLGHFNILSCLPHTHRASLSWFPLSSVFEPLTHSFYHPKINKLALAQPMLICSYLKEEVALGRMSAPYSTGSSKGSLGVGILSHLLLGSREGTEWTWKILYCTGRLL